MNPKRWHLITWVVFLIWLFFSVWANIPNDPANFADQIAPATTPEGLTLTAYETTFTFGWPTTYMQMTPRDNAASRKYLFPVMLCINIVLIAANQLAIIYLCQKRMQRFSIRSIFIATTLIAIMLVIGKLVSLFQSYYLSSGYVLFVYFLPLAVALILITRRKNSTPQNCCYRITRTAVQNQKLRFCSMLRCYEVQKI